MNILVFGAGYVGLSNAVMLASKHYVKVVDIDKNKIKQLQDGISPIKDPLIENQLKKQLLKIDFVSEIDSDLNKFQTVLIATPTDFDSKSNFFNTRSIENILKKLKAKNFKKLVVIRSTVPIGFTAKMQKKYKFSIAFFPEFLSEGQALRDNLYPSRIICGSESQNAIEFLKILKKCAKKKKISSIIVSSTEAESIKLFSNTYLAMRVAFFNEVDSFASSKNISSRKVIDGISLDKRIGSHYNNPSFGYGGYCLPKDTRQLKANFKNIPQKLISATIQANTLRKKFISDAISKTEKSKIGIYRLLMKSGSDNIRESSIIDVIKDLKKLNKEILIFEPTLNKKMILGIKVENDLEAFLNWSDLVVANRLDNKIKNVDKLIFSRDLFGKN